MKTPNQIITELVNELVNIDAYVIDVEHRNHLVMLATTVQDHINVLEQQVAALDDDVIRLTKERDEAHTKLTNTRIDLERALTRASEPEFAHAMPVVIRSILAEKLEVDDADELHAYDYNAEEMYDRIVHLVTRDASDVWLVEREFVAEVRITAILRVRLTGKSKTEVAEFLETDLPISIEASRYAHRDFELDDVDGIDIEEVQFR